MNDEKYPVALRALLKELRDLDLSGTVEQQPHPVGAGGHCDVYRGKVRDDDVAIKRIRHHLFQDKEAQNKLAKVLLSALTFLNPIPPLHLTLVLTRSHIIIYYLGPV